LKRSFILATAKRGNVRRQGRALVEEQESHPELAEYHEGGGLDYARPQSGHRTSGPETRKPRPTRDVAHL